MFSPFQEFQRDNHFRILNQLNTADDLLSSAEDNIKGNAEINKDGIRLSHVFLSMQAEILLEKDTTLVLQPRRLAEAGFNSAGVYDGKEKTLTLTADNRGNDIAKTAAHEMTHGIEHVIMGYQNENKIELITEGYSTKDFVPIYEAIKSVLPKGASKINAEFNAQVVDNEIKDKIPKGTTLSQEIGAYSNEAIFNEIRSDGGVEGFVTRYQNISVNGITSTSQRIRDSAQAVKDTAQEIIAISIYDINNHIINRLKERDTPGDIELAGILQSVNNELEPAYNRAQTKYKHIFTKPIQQQGEASEAAQSSHPDPSVTHTATVPYLSADHSVSDDTFQSTFAKNLQRSLSAAATPASELPDTPEIPKTTTPVPGTANSDPLSLINTDARDASSSPEADRTRTYTQRDSPSDSPTSKRGKSGNDQSDPAISSDLHPHANTQGHDSRNNSTIPPQLQNTSIVVEDSSQPLSPTSTPPVSPSTARKGGWCNIL